MELLTVKYRNILVITIICLISISFQYQIINQFPQNKHSWAQCDRYALAQGFVNNKGDFFHPETYLLNKQFPGDFKVAHNNSITSVDFPIYEYVISFIMRLCNSTSPWIFRVFTLLYGIIGLFYLYRITTLFTDSLFKSVIVVLFAAISPTYLYYQAGFLPTIPSLSNALIGLFFFFKYHKTKITKYYIISLVFITIATLARLPFLIVLVAMCCLEIVCFIKTKRVTSIKLVYIIFSFVFIFSYYLYNNYLRDTYGSLFLNHLIPAAGLNEVFEYIVAVYDRWVYKYFTPLHYIMLFMSLVLFIGNLIIKKTTITDLQLNLLLFTLIMLVGCVMYFFVMEFQFLDHDYYFLDTFYIPIVFLFLFFVVKVTLPNMFLLKRITVLLLILIFTGSFLYTKTILVNERTSQNTNIKPTADNFKNADLFLDSLNISKSAKILVIAADGPNNPLLLMKRKGYMIIYPDYDRVKIALTWPYDYVVLENDKLISEIYNTYPDIINQLEHLANNNNITVYKKKKANDNCTITSFLNLDNSLPIYNTIVNFDSISNNSIDTINIISNYFEDGKSYVTKPNIEYGYTHRLKTPYQLNKKSTLLIFKAMFLAPEKLNELLLCVSIKGKDDILFSTYDLSRRFISSNWKKEEILFSIPKITEKESELSVFIWNRGRNTIFYDNFEVIIY